MIVDLSLPATLVGDLHGITASRVYQLVKYYRTNGVYPIPLKRGLPAAVVSPSIRLKILSAKATLRIGTKELGKYLREIKGFSIGNRAIHRILLEESMTHPDPKKGIRHRPWVRYEHEFSLEAVHMDWHVSKFNGKQVCVVLDDARRMILAGKEFDACNHAKFNFSRGTGVSVISSLWKDRGGHYGSWFAILCK